MLIDTHCHLDAQEFDQDRTQVVARAVEAGVRAVVIPAVGRGNFQTVRDLAHAMPGGAYALGIHPLFVGAAWDDDLAALRAAVEAAMDDPRFVAIGEIGLDFFVKEIASGEARDKQERYYAAQLDLAAEFGLPVLLHVRRSQDIVLKHLRRHPGVRGGIAHAFNGSEQQARGFIDLGFALGIGGAMTFPRALQIRRHAQQLGLEHLVLETDSPDIPPAWLHEPDRRNTPAQVAGVARALAELRGTDATAVAAGTAATALRVLPRLVPVVA
ncbi:TatD family hydrolase [Bordetella sputigena]|uniref:TatD family hydrolase n=1 Tax=Bordetella sputigena TaxID=1416810 RepID=UPI0039F0E3FE